MSINPDRVDQIFRDCLFTEGETTEGFIEAPGIMVTVGFHPGRLESHRSEVEAMLNELPEQFRQSGGGGWSFLNACMDRHGDQWTGLHQRMDQLFQLGTALGRVECQLPRELWPALPGGMPYYVIKDKPGG